MDAFRGAEAPLVYGAAGAPARGCPHGAAPAPAFPTQRPGLTLIIGLALMVGLSLTAGGDIGSPQIFVADGVGSLVAGGGVTADSALDSPNLRW